MELKANMCVDRIKFIFLLLSILIITSHGVSIRRRKNLLGQRPESNQMEADVNAPLRLSEAQSNPVTLENSAKSKPKDSSLTITEKTEKQKEKTRYTPSPVIKDPKRKNTGKEKAWFERQKAARDKGDEKAIEFFNKIRLTRLTRRKTKRERIRRGIATEVEKDQNERMLAKQKEYRINHRERLNENKRRWKARQKIKAKTKKVIE